MTSVEPVESMWERVEECGVCGSTDYVKLFSVQRKSFVKCTGCGVTRLYERVAANKLGVIYDDYYDSSDAQLSEQELAAQLANPTFAFRRKRLENFIPENRRIIFEVGCGDGNFLAYLRSFGWQVGGCEFSERTLWLIKQRHNLDVMLGDFTMSRMTLEPVENVCAYHTLEHVYEPRAWMESLRRMLKPGGLLHLQLPNYQCPERYLAKECWGSLCFPQHVYFYSPANLKRMLAEQGFQTLSTQTYDPWHGPGSMLISAKNVVKRLLTGKTPWPDSFDSPACDTLKETCDKEPKPGSPVNKMLNTVAFPVALTFSRAQSLFGFGNVIDIVARAS